MVTSTMAQWGVRTCLRLDANQEELDTIMERSAQAIELVVARAKLLEELPDGVVVLDDHLHLVDMNAAAHQYLGIPDNAVGQNAAEAIPHWSSLKNLLGSTAQHLEWQSPSRWLRVDSLPFEERRHRWCGYLLLVRDISEQKQIEEKLRYLATTDELTGLWNRRCFTQRFDDEMARAKRYGHPLSLIVCDIDRFKRVNDTKGHAAGDAALQHIAAAMKNAVRQMDIVGRIGGEEFAILLPNTDPSEAMQTAERLRQEIATRPFRRDGELIHLTASLGVTTYNHCTSSLDQMLRVADHALYQAKAQGRNRTVYRREPEKTRDVATFRQGG